QDPAPVTKNGGVGMRDRSGHSYLLRRSAPNLTRPIAFARHEHSASDRLAGRRGRDPGAGCGSDLPEGPGKVAAIDPRTAARLYRAPLEAWDRRADRRRGAGGPRRLDRRLPAPA